jgi:hypothetical protein
MTYAEQLMTAKLRNGGLARAARDLDRSVEQDDDAGMTFFHFSDGSVVGARGRGKNHEMWIVRTAPLA